MEIEIVYGTAEKQSMLQRQVPPQTSVKEALLQSGILSLWPEIDFENCKVGIFGKIVSLETTLKDQDRIEVYRPLAIDHKQARQLRAHPRKA